MLKTLSVTNYALIDALEMELDNSLNIITGETGAGKSILLGALGLILGNKNDSAAIKDNSHNCIIEGCFDISAYNLESFFEEYDLEYDEEIVVRRVITPAGKSRVFLNDIPIQLADLKALGSRLIDIHSQHQNRKLSDESYRLSAIDAVADNGELLAKYKESYNSLTQSRKTLKEAQEAIATLSREQEWLRFQVEEFEALKLREGEGEELESEINILENGDKISEALLHLHNAVEADDIGILTQLKGCQSQMLSLENSYQPAQDYTSRLMSVVEELKDLSRSAANDNDRISTDTNRLATLTNRLDSIISLQQKHRVNSYEELLDVERRLCEQYSKIVNSDEHIASLKQDVALTQSKALSIADKLHATRERAAKKLSSNIEAIIVKLGMMEAKFNVDISKKEELSANGYDSADFLFSANKGKTPQSIDKIASGGEISRIMLAIKATLAKSLKLPTIIFDEIDTGVSGRIASAMGDIIAELSLDMQVVDITHLPQVAAKGNTHFVVYKESSRTNIVELTAGQRVEHIAMMLSADNITPAALEQAYNLLSNK
ncbi:MAG: DNA repair protein RecN [Rikenellaceae bacterium]